MLMNQPPLAWILNSLLWEMSQILFKKNLTCKHVMNFDFYITENLKAALVLFATFIGYASFLLSLWAVLQGEKKKPFSPLLYDSKIDHKNKINVATATAFSP